MHHAPSVSYPVGRSRFALVLATAACACGAAAVAAWALASDAVNWRHAAGAVAWLAAVAASVFQWRRSPCGQLEWDGSQWLWDGVPTPAPRLAVDLQHWMLLEAGHGGPGWLSVERDAAPSHWDALRRALYSPASTAAPQAAPPPVQST
jgi:toxin CptA